MHKHVPVIAAAVLAVGGLAFGQAQQQETQQWGQDQQQQQGAQAEMAAGQVGGAQELQRQIPSQAANVKEDASSKREVQKVIATVTEAAITEGRFDQIKESLAKSDKDRMDRGSSQMGQQPTAQPGQMGQQAGAQGQSGQQSQELDNAIRELKQAYREKYNRDLRISESSILPDRVTVVSGEVTNPQMLTTWPLRATQTAGTRAGMDFQQDQAQPAAGGLPQGHADPAGGLDHAQPAAGGIGQQTSTQRQQGQQGQQHSAQHGGLKQGDKIAAVRIPGENQMPELTVSLVQTDNKWQLDLPDTVDSNKIRQNLTQHIRHITQNKDRLPQDADKASQRISHHVLMALYDVDVQQAGGQQRQGGM